MSSSKVTDFASARPVLSTRGGANGSPTNTEAQAARQRRNELLAEQPSREFIQSILDVLYEPGQVGELRCLGPKGKGYDRCGFFNDNKKLADLIYTFSDGSYSGLYVTINPLDPAVLARASNHLVVNRAASSISTRANEVVKRTRLVLDFDPIRPSGISATADEKVGALRSVEFCREYLCGQRHWAMPLYMDSGNGYHLVFGIDLPNEKESTDLLKALFSALRYRFREPCDRYKVKLDDLFDAPRIIKAYGSLAAKGEHTEDRPWRWSVLAETRVDYQLPPTLDVVTREQLEEIAAEQQEEIRKSFSQPRSKSSKHEKSVPDLSPPEKIEAFLKAYEIEYREREEQEPRNEKDWRYLWKTQCVFNPDHAQDGKAAVMIMGDGKFSFNCFHASCKDLKWKAFRLKCKELKPEVQFFFAGGDNDLSHDALADEFSERYEDIAKYVKQQKWMIWDEERKLWIEDAYGLVTYYARIMLREKAEELRAKALAQRKEDDEREIDLTFKALRSNSTIKAVAEQATHDPRHHVPDNTWDPDHEVLNTPGGIVELKTGTIREPRLTDYCTLSTTTAPDFTKPPDLWLSCLKTWTRENQDLQDYLQRSCGYSLSGLTNEENFFFLWGTGKNGKSVFKWTLHQIMGTYAKTAMSSTFVKNPLRNPRDAELADLIGARLVTTDETSTNATFDEAMLKSTTGGEARRARQVYEKSVEFIPAWKLWMSGNNKPKLTKVDVAIRRRFHLIPFTANIENKNRYLKDELRGELPSIFAWMIQGFQQWKEKERGLDPPQIVVDTTNEYLDEEDLVQCWKEECTRENWASGPVDYNQIFASLEDWAYANHKYARISRQEMGERLEQLGCRREKKRHGAVIYGIEIIQFDGNGGILDSPPGYMKTEHPRGQENARQGDMYNKPKPRRWDI
jgi:P4 family phage/plasmid primase-like protien